MNNKGFTLIEIVMVIVLLGSLAAIALPKYQDLSVNAKVSARDGALGAIRAAVAMGYANNAVNYGLIAFPGTITGTMFAEGVVPINPVAGTNEVRYAVSGESRVGCGWYYHSDTGSIEPGT